jgi:hypothetical protein
LLVVGRACIGKKGDGSPCGAAPLHDGDFCLWHDPDKADEVAEARRLGGQRRRRERVVAGAYDFEGLASIPAIRRLVEVAVLDTLGLENSVARARTLAYLAQSATKLLETGELEDRLAAIEAVIETRTPPAGRFRR